MVVVAFVKLSRLVLEQLQVLVLGIVDGNARKAFHSRHDSLDCGDCRHSTQPSNSFDREDRSHCTYNPTTSLGSTYIFGRRKASSLAHLNQSVACKNVW